MRKIETAAVRDAHTQADRACLDDAAAVTIEIRRRAKEREEMVKEGEEIRNVGTEAKASWAKRTGERNNMQRLPEMQRKWNYGTKKGNKQRRPCTDQSRRQRRRRTNNDRVNKNKRDRTYRENERARARKLTLVERIAREMRRRRRREGSEGSCVREQGRKETKEGERNEEERKMRGETEMRYRMKEGPISC